MTNRSLCHDISSGHFYPGYWDDLFIRLNEIQKKRFNFCARVLCFSSTRICGGSETQTTFHKSLVADHCFTFWKVTLTLTLSLVNQRPKVSF